MAQQQQPQDEDRPPVTTQPPQAEARGPHREGRASRAVGYGVAVIVNLILLFVVNNLLNWGVPFITGEYVAVLWAINLSLGATALANFLFLIYDPSWFRRLAQIVLNGLSFLSTLVFYTIFPLDLGTPFWNQMVRFAMLVGMAGIVIGTIVEFTRLITNRE